MNRDSSSAVEEVAIDRFAKLIADLNQGNEQLSRFELSQACLRC